MITRFTRTITLTSGNLARNFRFNDRGHGRVMVTYEYTDRRRDHKVARHFTAEFLNGRLESIIARSARGGRVEFFKSSAIINELLEMLAEFNEIVNGVVARRYEPAKVEAPAVESEQDDTSDLMNTLKTVGTMVAINLMVTLVTLGIVWYNL